MKKNRFNPFMQTAVIEIECNNRARLLMALTKAKIRVLGVEITPNIRLKITIPYFECEKTFAICDNMCYNYRVCNIFSVRARVKTLLSRLGFIVGALLTIIASALTSDRYLEIKIYGLTQLTQSEVKNYLSDCGVRVGAKKSEVGYREIENYMLGYSGVANCEVSVKGGVVEIRVIENTNPTPPPQVKSAIVSDCNGRVKKIVCRSGTSKVKVGQIVKVGETLIDGALYDGNGELMQSVTAVGEVVIETNHTQVYFTSDYHYESVYTGRETVITGFSVFGLNLFSPTPPYENFVAVTTKKTLEGILPVVVIQTHYRQVERVRVQKSLTDYAQSVAKSLENETVLPNERVLSSRYDTQKIGENEYQVTVVITTERTIN